MSARNNKAVDLKASPGSPQPGEPVYLMIGRLRRSHGINGDLLLELLTEFPERIKPGVTIHIGSAKTSVIISNIRLANKLYIVSFKGYESEQVVKQFSNQWIYIRTADAAPLPEGRYYHHEIVGLRVLTEKRELLGEISEIMVTGANDVYVIKDQNGGESLIPAIKSVIVKYDLEAGEVIIRQQEWL